MTIDKKFESLFQIKIQFQGADHVVNLRVPPFGELFGLILQPQHRTPERMSVMFPAEFKRLIASLDGRVVDIESARGLYADPHAAGQIVAARNKLLETLAEQGRIFAQCPYCFKWEAELNVIAMTVALQQGPWPIIDERMFLAVPSLAQQFPPNRQPRTILGASRIRFELPSSVIGLGAPVTAGILRDADREGGTLEQLAWDRVKSQIDKTGREQWRSDVPGFRAVLRLAIALQALDGLSTEITPQVIMDMPAVDFYFLDNLHYLVYNADIQDEHKARLECRHCFRSFLPVMDPLQIVR